VDNGQVAVFAALSQGDDVAMVDVRLYLSKEWTDDKKRCERCRIPKENQRYKTKPELGLEMITEMGNRVAYDWIGRDCAYGNSKELRLGITKLQRLYVMDVAETLAVYLEDPKPFLLKSKKGKGRNRSCYVTDCKPLKNKELFKSITDSQWKEYTVRKGTKGFR